LKLVSTLSYSVLVLVNKLFWLEHILVYLWRAEHIATASAVKSFLWQQIMHSKNLPAPMTVCSLLGAALANNNKQAPAK